MPEHDNWGVVASCVVDSLPADVPERIQKLAALFEVMPATDPHHATIGEMLTHLRRFNSLQRELPGFGLGGAR